MTTLHCSASRHAVFALSLVVAASIALPTPAAERDVQIASINFLDSVIELRNFGTTDQPLDGWRFCSHSDDNGERRYTSPSGFNGVTISSGESLFFWLGNDAPLGDPNSLNVSSLGGQFATTMDQDAYSVNLYWPEDGSLGFSDAGDMVDHIQWNIDGVGSTAADVRNGTAQQAVLWSDQDAWIATSETTLRIELMTDALGQPVAGPHGPSSYLLIGAPSFAADFDGDDDVDADDLTAAEVGWEARFGVDLEGQDFVNWQREFGSVATTASTTPVPEPSALTCALITALAGCCVHTKR